MIIIETVNPKFAKELCLKITADLPEYFGLPGANERYAAGVRKRTNLVAKVNSEYAGFISIDFPYPENASIYWLGILRKFHRQGIGKNLAEAAFHQAKVKGAKTITVETLAPDEGEEIYLNTYKFYRQAGFTPLFNLKPEGYKWNMVYLVKTL